MAKVLVACEFTGCVRNEFLKAGHDTWSVDLKPSLDGSNRHITGNVLDVLKYEHWDLLMVAHPPCTRLCNSGVRWLHKPPKKLTAEHYTDEEIYHYAAMTEPERLAFMWKKLDEGCELFSELWNADIPLICMENPVMHKYAKQRIENYVEFSQSVQPWQFGHGETKRTCLWLKGGLPKLVPTNIVEGRDNRVHRASPGPDRWAERSKFFPGIAAAMVDQWAETMERVAA